MGKNQEKRKAKSIKHARQVWAKKQISAATFWKSLNEAEAQINEHLADLSEDDQQAIQQQIHEQRLFIKEYVLKARDNFIAAVGPEVADEDFNLDEL